MAAKGLLIILSLMILFHLLILLSIIPFDMVWGGRLKDTSEKLLYETVSVAVNLIMLAVVGVHTGYLKLKINRVVIKCLLWAMFFIFLLNTVGNSISDNGIEKAYFTPLTLLLSLLSLRLAVS